MLLKRLGIFSPGQPTARSQLVLGKLAGKRQWQKRKHKNQGQELVNTL